MPPPRRIASLTATLHGAVTVWRLSEVSDPYLGTVVAARDEWVAEHPEELPAFRDAGLEAVRVLLDPDRAGGLEPVPAEVFGVLDPWTTEV